ncbi:hypothetical protein HDU97_007324 [Phlyctochytrium planicorne]|nr:hypothetical protein HDU97_007324 [Phlyctochytrium planicorne]
MSSLPESMHAIIINSYGDKNVLSYEKVPTPSLDPSKNKDDANSFIIRVKAAGANPADVKIRRGDLSLITGKTFPIYLGVDFSGEIVAVGPSVTNFKVGDDVYGRFGGITRRGGQAEYAKISTTLDLVMKKPAGLDHAKAGSLPVASLTAYVGLTTPGYGLSLSDPSISSKHVLIIGASGGIGSWATLIAKKFGAKVTAVASGKNKEYVLGLGADTFVDYTTGSAQSLFTKEGEFDIILDTVGGDDFYNISHIILKKTGLYSTAVGHMEHGGDSQITIGGIFSMMGTSMFRSYFASRKYNMINALGNDQFGQMEKWLAEGAFKVFPKLTTMALSDAKQGHEVLESHRAVGKIVYLP